MPTETVYGLAGAAFDPAAVARVFAAKERPAFDPLIAHVALGDPLVRVSEVADLGPLSERARSQLRTLVEHAWPGPLTVVLPRRPEVSDLVTSGLPTVAVRMPAHPVAQALLEAFGAPVVAPSANRFGRISPTTAAAVVEELGDVVPYVLDGGPCEVGVESTVVRLGLDGRVTVLRPGGVSVECLEGWVGEVRHGPSTDRPESPGQLSQHYAPTTPLTLLPAAVAMCTRATLLGAVAGQPVALLRVLGPVGPAVEHLEGNGIRVVGAVTLSARGDPEEAAQRLFAALRELDASEAPRILAEPAAVEGLGHAIADRLQRASVGRYMLGPCQGRRSSES